MSAQSQHQPSPDDTNVDTHCPSCEAGVADTDAYCPECGWDLEKTTTSPSRIGHRALLAIGLLSGLIAFLFVPIVFGPVAMFCAWKLYTEHSELHGIIVFALGALGLVIGMLIGMLYIFAM